MRDLAVPEMAPGPMALLLRDLALNMSCTVNGPRAHGSLVIIICPWCHVRVRAEPLYGLCLTLDRYRRAPGFERVTQKEFSFQVINQRSLFFFLSFCP